MEPRHLGCYKPGCFFNWLLTEPAHAGCYLISGWPQGFDAHPFEEAVGTFQIRAVVPVVLHEAAHIQQHVVMGIDGAK
jgi:hypothetical protein